MSTARRLPFPLQPAHPRPIPRRTRLSRHVLAQLVQNALLRALRARLYRRLTLRQLPLLLLPQNPQLGQYLQGRLDRVLPLLRQPLLIILGAHALILRNHRPLQLRKYAILLLDPRLLLPLPLHLLPGLLLLEDVQLLWVGGAVEEGHARVVQLLQLALDPGSLLPPVVRDQRAHAVHGHGAGDH